MVGKGKEIRVTFDNFDYNILTNIITNEHKNTDMHWTCQYITFDRVSCANLDDKKPLVQDINEFENTQYLLSEEEQKKMKEEYVILVVRILVEFFPCLKSLEGAIPQHIKHEFSKDMSQKSTIISMPVVPYNQNKTSDVAKYLEYLTSFLTKVYSNNQHQVPPNNASSAEKAKHASNVLKKKSIPLVGDLLGRERATSAKKSRAGCDYDSDRFKHIVEAPAVWHSKQFFLMVFIIHIY